jgi:multicomponent Na+:H+ antiporter subunit A
MTSPQPENIAGFFVENAYTRGVGTNLVNVILVDFRGFDTLGETTVIALSAIIAWSLLGPRVPRDARFLATPKPAAFVLVMATPVFYWLLLALSVVVLLRGHNEIGGGFVGGLTGALAFAIVALAHGVNRARAKLRVHPVALAGGGLLLTAASGLPGLLASGDYLRHLWFEANVFGVPVKQGTTLVFDLGVYLAVLGTVLAFLFGLTREAER